MDAGSNERGNGEGAAPMPWVAPGADAVRPPHFAVPPVPRSAPPHRTGLPYGAMPPPGFGRPPPPPGAFPYAAGYLAPMRTPSGLFPTGPPRPTYREPLRVGLGPTLLGALGGALWMGLFAAVATNARGYVWTTIAAGVAAWLAALLLVRLGDRGVGVGLSISAGLGIAAATILVIVRWVGGHWLLW